MTYGLEYITDPEEYILEEFPLKSRLRRDFVMLDARCWFL